MKLAVWIIFTAAAAMNFSNSQILAQADLAQEDKSEAQEESEAFGAANDATLDTLASRFREERQSFLSLLDKEIIPNLPARDVERLRRSVQRLGSYRADWARSAQEFLIANAPVAELLVYRFSLYKNPRLNHHLLHTLVSMENLRFPRAALAFAETFALDISLKRKVLFLLAKAINQDASVAPDVITLLSSSFADGLTTLEKLAFAAESCRAWPKVPPASVETLKVWTMNPENLWARLLTTEVEACVKGL